MSTASERMSARWADPVFRATMIARRKATYTPERIARAAATNRANGKSRGITPWNKGLTKDADYRMFLASEKSIERRMEIHPETRRGLTDAERTRAWRLKHRDLYLAQLRRHREKHKDRRAIYIKQWAKDNPERKREHRRRYKLRHAWTVSEYNRKWKSKLRREMGTIMTLQARNHQMPEEFPIFSEALATSYRVSSRTRL